MIADTFVEEVILGLGAQKFKLAASNAVLLTNQTVVAIESVQFVLKEGKGDLPADRDGLPAKHLRIVEPHRRGRAGQTVGCQSGIRKIPHGLFVECAHVEVEHERFARRHHVPHP